MRTEQEMLDLVLKTAREDENIRLVGMNGSRANPRAPRDRFQDFDIVYLVRDMEPYIRDRGWIDRFGPRVILQTPEDMALFPATLGGWFTYLMQFEDGNRIDLMLIPVGDTEKYLHNDSQTVILLDKDGRPGTFPRPATGTIGSGGPRSGSFRTAATNFGGSCSMRRKESGGASSYTRPRTSAAACGGNCFGCWPGRRGLCMDSYSAPGRNINIWNSIWSRRNGRRSAGHWTPGSLARCARALEEAVGLFRCASAETAQRLGYVCPDYDEKVTAYRKGLEVEE